MGVILSKTAPIFLAASPLILDDRTRLHRCIILSINYRLINRRLSTRATKRRLNETKRFITGFPAPGYHLYIYEYTPTYHGIVNYLNKVSLMYRRICVTISAIM